MTAGGSIFSGIPAVDSTLAQFIVQVVVILGTTRVLVNVLKPLKQPAVIAEIVSGIVLGPSILGQIPHFSETIFPAESMSHLQLFANIGLLLFMFCVGAELPLSVLRRNWRKSIAISLTGIAVPFALGAAASVAVYEIFPLPGVSFGSTLMFCGVVTSITAFPVLARILTELRIMGTHAGATSMNAAAVDDVFAWCILAVVLGIVRASAPLTALYTILSTAAFVLFMALLVRPVLGRLFVWMRPHHESDEVSTPVLVVILVIMLLSSWITELLGVDAIFGAFITGAITPRTGNLHIAIGHKIETLTVAFFLPLYFTFSGIRTTFTSLNTGPAWGVVFIVIAAAFIGKLGGCTIAAWLSGMSWKESLVVGSLMNARGLVALIVLNIGLSYGAISQATFTCFVLMCLATTFAAVPLINCIYPPHLMREDHNRQVIEQQQATVSVSASPDVTSLSPVDLEAESEGFFPEEGLTRSGNMAEESKRHTAAAPPMLRRNVVCLASDPLQAASLTTVAALLTGGLLAATECIPVPLEPTIAASQPPAQDASSPSQVLLMHCKLASENPSSYIPHMDSLSTFAAGDAMRVLPAELVIAASGEAVPQQHTSRGEVPSSNQDESQLLIIQQRRVVLDVVVHPVPQDAEDNRDASVNEAGARSLAMQGGSNIVSLISRLVRTAMLPVFPDSMGASEFAARVAEESVKYIDDPVLFASVERARSSKQLMQRLQLGVLETSPQHVIEDVRQLSGSKAARLVILPASIDAAAVAASPYSDSLGHQQHGSGGGVLVRSEIVAALLAPFSIRCLRAPVALLVAATSLPPTLHRVLVIVQGDPNTTSLARLLLRHASVIASSGAAVTVLHLLPTSYFTPFAPTSELAADDTLASGAPSQQKSGGQAGTLGETQNSITGTAMHRLALASAQQSQGIGGTATAEKPTQTHSGVAATPEAVLTSEGLAQFYAAKALLFRAGIGSTGHASIICRSESHDYGSAAVTVVLEAAAAQHLHFQLILGSNYRSALGAQASIAAGSPLAHLAMRATAHSVDSSAAPASPQSSERHIAVTFPDTASPSQKSSADPFPIKSLVLPPPAVSPDSSPAAGGPAQQQRAATTMQSARIRAGTVSAFIAGAMATTSGATRLAPATVLGPLLDSLYGAHVRQPPGLRPPVLVLQAASVAPLANNPLSGLPTER